MHDVAFPKKAHGVEKLVSICSDSTDIKTNIFTELFNDVSEIHAGDESNKPVRTCTREEYRTSWTRRRGTDDPDVRMFSLDEQYASCPRDPPDLIC